MKKDIEVSLVKASIPPTGYGLAPIAVAWDGSKEVEKSDVATLLKICTWVDSDKPELKESYKLPHHYADEGHITVWNGVKLAMSSLLGGAVTIPEVDRSGVYNHLVFHYDQFDKDAPTFKSVFEDFPKKIATLQALKGLAVDEDRKLIKDIIIELYSFYLEKSITKAAHGKKRKPRK